MTTELSPPPAAPPAPTGRRRWLILLGATVTVGALAWGLWYGLVGRWHEGTDDAYVNGNVVQITPQVTGTVVSIGADDGNRVTAGQALVTLDSSDSDVKVAQAEANLAATVRRVRGLYSTVQGAQADVAQRRVAVAQAQADYNRRKTLAASGAISAEELSHASDELMTAQSGLLAAQQQYQTNKVLVDDTVVASHPDVQASAAQLRAALLDEARTTLPAPVEGFVAQRAVQVGQRVQPGAPLMAVVPLHEVWVDANFKETQLTHMRLGQPVTITSDLYGSQVTYQGQITSLGVGTGSVFSLLPAQNATGNWIKIVQRVPVRVVFTKPEELTAHPLRLGLSLKVEVNVHDQEGALLPTQAPTQPVFSTAVYAQQLAHANATIAAIIHANMGAPASR